MKVVISDANVIIDMVDCGLIDNVFELPYQFTVPDMLFSDELGEQHSNLIELGMVLLELTPQSLIKTQTLNAEYSRVSFYDCLAMVAAEQESCMLLTGDGALRKLATKENIEVRGTIWLMEQLIINNIVDKNDTEKAFNDMKKVGSRLPWKEVKNY
jgi:predicted nucleic acid-binding protein